MMLPSFRMLWTALLSGPYLLLWPDLLLPLAEQALPDALWRDQSGARTVALTFDDGPDPFYTPQVLAILQKHGIRATFFLVGERVRRYPELLAKIRAGGHEIGNHSDTWRSTRSLSAAEFEQDLLQAEKSLDLQNVSPKLFRPAGGIIGRKHARIARAHGYVLVLASALPFDVYRPPAGWIAFLVRRSLTPGAIVVLHDSGGDRSRTIAALPRIIDAAHRRSLQFVTVSDML
jgi:chitin deacetylase